MTIVHTWKRINPSAKLELAQQGGDAIADPLMVIRGCIITDDTEQTFSVYTPPITGRLEHVIIIPDHNNPPDANFDLELYQHYIEAPPIFDAGAAPIADTLDFLNGQGENIGVGVITHMGVASYFGQDVIIAKPFVQDVLRLSFEEWSDGSEDIRAIYIYIYFSAAT